MVKVTTLITPVSKGPRLVVVVSIPGGNGSCKVDDYWKITRSVVIYSTSEARGLSLVRLSEIMKSDLGESMQQLPSCYRPNKRAGAAAIVELQSFSTKSCGCRPVERAFRYEPDGWTR